MLRIALPKGRLLEDTAGLLEKAGWDLSDYSKKARLYRLKSSRFAGAQIKMLQDKDIPIQVSVGNYDVGICSLDWVDELFSRYPSSSISSVMKLGYGHTRVYAAVALSSKVHQLEDFFLSGDRVRIASEYPNMAERYAALSRLKRFAILPVWGGVEGYPPDDADVVLIAAAGEDELVEKGLRPLSEVSRSEAVVVVNKDSLASKDLSEVIGSIAASRQHGQTSPVPTGRKMPVTRINSGRAPVRLALPDGHQQVHVKKILQGAGIEINDYPSLTGNRCPESDLENVDIKVIRPQDMPLLVANGSFDLAITGRDWLTEHTYQFPTSPLEELVDLKYGKVKIVSVVNGDSEIDNMDDLIEKYPATIFRIATEYINIADRYARTKRLGRYRIIPTWGATEAFIPEDADILIENTETGGTIARHNLKIVDTLFISTACVIGRKGQSTGPRQQIIERLIGRLKEGVANQ